MTFAFLALGIALFALSAGFVFLCGKLED